MLFKGGRLPSWHRLTEAEREATEREHIDLMLSVARKHGMMLLEGFKLIGPQQPWERFWTIEFPDPGGAEAWIDAEMAPPYGLYGYYEYYIARRWGRDYFSTWETRPRTLSATTPAPDPHKVPALASDPGSIVVLLFGRTLPEHDATPLDVRGDAEHIELMKSVAREHGLIRLEGFRIVGPQPDWQRAWVTEFPTLAGAEAWMDAEVLPPLGAYARKSMYLARRWAPDYFATWVSS